MKKVKELMFSIDVITDNSVYTALKYVHIITD